MTSYDSAIDEFGESVRLDRGMLYAVNTVLPLLTENGHLRVDKRSCSLPNLVSDSSPRPTSYPGPSEGDMSLLSGWVQSEEGKRNSANLESITEESPARHVDSFYDGPKRGSDENSLQGSETAEGSCCIQISRNSDVGSPDLHTNGCLNNACAAKVLVRRNVPQWPERRQNGHFRKTALRPTDANFANGRGLQSVNNHDENIDEDSVQDSAPGLRTGKLNAQICYRIANLPEDTV